MEVINETFIPDICLYGGVCTPRVCVCTSVAPISRLSYPLFFFRASSHLRPSHSHLANPLPSPFL